MYSVSKQFGKVTVGNPPLVFKDSSGNIVLTAKANWSSRGALLVDQQGKEVGTIKKKGFSLTSKATYQFFDASNNQIGQAVLKTGMFGMSENISLQDPSGNPVASATGNFAGFNYEITDANGNKTLAKIYRSGSQQQQGGGLKGLLTNMAAGAMSGMMGAYTIEIADKTINDMSRLFVLELVVVLDEMYRQNTGGGPGGFSMGGGPGMIKL
jgi:hypothetical protein